MRGWGRRMRAPEGAERGEGPGEEGREGSPEEEESEGKGEAWAEE